MERRKFTREFKLEAVKLIKERGVSVAQAEVWGMGLAQSRNYTLRRLLPSACVPVFLRFLWLQNGDVPTPSQRISRGI
jgi:hypothetical protein